MLDSMWETLFTIAGVGVPGAVVGGGGVYLASRLHSARKKAKELGMSVAAKTKNLPEVEHLKAKPAEPEKELRALIIERDEERHTEITERWQRSLVNAQLFLNDLARQQPENIVEVTDVLVSLLQKRKRYRCRNTQEDRNERAHFGTHRCMAPATCMNKWAMQDGYWSLLDFSGSEKDDGYEDYAVLLKNMLALQKALDMFPYEYKSKQKVQQEVGSLLVLVGVYMYQLLRPTLQTLRTVSKDKLAKEQQQAVTLEQRFNAVLEKVHDYADALTEAERQAAMFKTPDEVVIEVPEVEPEPEVDPLIKQEDAVITVVRELVADEDAPTQHHAETLITQMLEARATLENHPGHTEEAKQEIRDLTNATRSLALQSLQRLASRIQFTGDTETVKSLKTRKNYLESLEQPSTPA